MHRLKAISVLLVEDDTIDAENVRRLLPRETTIHRASTLEAATAVLLQVELDLILLDPGLPDSSGVETFLRIRDDAPRVPVVILTGLANKEQALEIIRQGAQDYLLKNQFDDRAMQAIYFAVERGRLLRQLESEQLERERLLSELREREQSLAHLGRVALMGELVAEITHEVSQPLNAVSTLTGALSTLLTDTQVAGSPIPELLSRLTTASAHAGHVLSRLREFIRDESTTLEPFDINEVVISTIDFVDYDRSRRKVQIRHALSDGPILAMGNKTQIQQVLVNLLRNAFDAMKDTADSKRFVTITTTFEECVAVEVADNGSGIAREAGDVFAPFLTTKDTGLGTGLAICARILHNHQGRIQVVSTGSAGTTFRFEIPLA